MATTTAPDENAPDQTAPDETAPPADAVNSPSASEPAIEPTVEPAVEPASESAPAESAAPEPAAPAVVYVTAPAAPRARGARGVGVVVALLGAGIFAALYGLLATLLAPFLPEFAAVGGLLFTATPAFWIPVVVFALAYILLIVIVNRAGWWAHVLGGFLVAIVVWVGFLGAQLIIAGAVGEALPVVGAVVATQLMNPVGFLAAIIAREVPVWVGWIVARRGRTARARNEAARAAYQKELAEHQATVSGRTAV
ncbi:hypothetical protein [Microcella frigidaquae]|uniref:Uncharacterized protein n=1 Tax=Microcella frigidaquae TaxID=424758 RepID=A0A840X5J4_9MICO|nr:hypothetical protein [Microcella frigidaquae]MBB5617803.1 hypothetical protein [Microcella frigidaquae]NHN45482.1 hypothetical protein [Microcella frigidaquae]